VEVLQGLYTRYGDVTDSHMNSLKNMSDESRKALADAQEQKLTAEKVIEGQERTFASAERAAEGWTKARDAVQAVKDRQDEWIAECRTGVKKPVTGCRSFRLKVPG
jgi:hypothetical protein